jgi:hypothetical protein
VAKTEPLTTDVDKDVKRRLKIYSAVTGQTIRSLVNKWLDEALPPLPHESEATT